MFNATQIWDTVRHRPACTAGLAITALAAVTLMLNSGGSANAVPPPAGGGGGGGGWGKHGGVVYNRTDMTIRVAELTGTARCRVLTPPLSYNPNHACRWKPMRPGANSRSYYPDTDAFRFDWDGQDFRYNGVRIPPRVYVKIRDPQKVVCTRIKGFAPRCFG